MNPTEGTVKGMQAGVGNDAGGLAGGPGPISAWMLELILVLSAVLRKYSDLAVVGTLLVVRSEGDEARPLQAE